MTHYTIPADPLYFQQSSAMHYRLTLFPLLLTYSLTLPHKTGSAEDYQLTLYALVNTLAAPLSLSYFPIPLFLAFYYRHILLSIGYNRLILILFCICTLIQPFSNLHLFINFSPRQLYTYSLIYIYSLTFINCTFITNVSCKLTLQLYRFIALSLFYSK